MIPTAGRPDRAPRRAPTGVHGGPPAALVALVAVSALTLGLTSCGGTARAGGTAGSADVTAWTHVHAGVRGVERQADAQHAAVTEAARTAAADAAERVAAGRSGEAGAAANTPGQCTARPEDRAACTMPEGAEITPGGGDIDGDGVFEKHEPVGPGHRDPRAYDGGLTSGEIQCEWARQQGYGC